MNETEDIVYRCKDCSKYNLCCYYHRRKETSQICHYFELQGKKGKWIYHSDDGYVECPICGHLTTCEGSIEDLHYCFWCGTRLEVD